MAKNKVPDAEDINLTPIMNMVLVLIPLMLLNVVFMTITLIEVTMPQRSAGAAMNNGDPPKRLQLFISKQGFTIVENGMPLNAIDGCAAGGPTVCAPESKKDAPLETDKQDWLSLYNELMKIKSKSDWATHEQIEIVADSAVNFGVLVKAMDIARFQLVPKSETEATKGKVLTSEEELNEARQVLIDGEDNTKTQAALFPVVILGLPTVTQ